MTSCVISVEHLSKQYDLGVIGTGTLSRDLNRWWARVRKQPDPYTRIGQKDAFERIGESILALDDISFTVQQGEALGIIGRNGAGKSTLLKILSRVTAPTSGVVKVKGRIGSLLEVGTGFHPELTGRENVFLNGAILGMKKAEVTRKFDEIVDFSGVEKFIDTPVKRYSSGMYVRLAFAVAAHLDPEILIVDEVLAVGDAEFQKKCLGKMGDVAGEGRTVLFVSHNMGAIQKLCSRSILLRYGVIIDDGSTSTVINNYLVSSRKGQTENLELRKDRKGKGDVRLTNNYISHDGIHQADFLLTGSSAFFIFEVSKPAIKINCRFSILNSSNIPIVHFNSSLSDEDTKDCTIFICHLDDLFLSPGSYSVSVMIFDKNGIQDHVEESMTFLVQAGQQNGRQISRESGYGLVSIPHRWIIHN